MDWPTDRGLQVRMAVAVVLVTLLPVGSVADTVSGVAAADGRVNMGTDGGRLVAFDGESGTKQWSKSLPVSADPYKSDVPSLGAGPGGLAVAWGTGDEYRLTVYAPDGSTLWARRFERSFNGRPRVRNGTVYTRSEHLQAFDRDSGSRRWVNEAITVPGGPLQFGRNDEIVYIPERHALIAVGTADGTERWRFNDERWASMERGQAAYETDIGATGAVPAPDGESVFLNTVDHGLFQFDTDGSLRWHEPRLDCSFLYAVTEQAIVHSGTEAIVARYR